MILFLKILSLASLIIRGIIILLFSASFFMQDKVVDIIIRSLNNNISTKLFTGSSHLSFIRRFPKASVELRNVLVHSSSDFNSAAFPGNTDTLLSVRFVSIEFKITDIIKGTYNIESISAGDGLINLYSDTTGLVNYNISAGKSSTENSDFIIDLDKITLTNLKATYSNLATRLKIDGIIDHARIRSRISGNNIEFTAGAEMLVDSLHLYNTKINNPFSTVIDLNLSSSDTGVVFNKGVLKVEDYDFSISGLVSSDNMLDLHITGNNLDLSRIRNYLPEKQLNLVSEYNPAGILSVNCQIKGLLSRTSNPHIEITTALNEGHISYGKSNLAVNDLSFSGFFSNGAANTPKTSTLLINNIKASLGSSDYSGSFIINGFENPYATLTLKGRVFPAEIKEFFALENIDAASGSADIDLKVSSCLLPRKQYSAGDVMDMKPEGTIVFDSLTIGFNNDRFHLDRISGKLLLSKTIKANDLQFSYKGQLIKINGDFTNLPEWLYGRPVRLAATADITFDRLIPEVFLGDPSSGDGSEGRKKAVNMPGDLMLDISYSIDSLSYDSFSSSKMTGSLNYKPGLLTFNTINMKSLEGTISGNGFIVQNRNKSLIGRGNFIVTGIDVNKTFMAFHNFGQDFLKAENLNGTLSGSFSLLLPMDSLANPQIRALTAEGKYVLTNGALINFDPVKELSEFIELSELENISFEKLENDFFIKNNFLYIPQMDVKSSAVDLSVNGRHSFDNDYEYHVKMLLSEILSKKRKKTRSSITEFGAVQDDGLGRTSLLLKVENKGEEVKVSYDIKAAGNEIKTNIKSERQTLKSILNQEYGWFKGDSSVQQKPAENKSRFSITWDEAAIEQNPVDSTEAKKEGILKTLFRKK